MPKGVFNWCYDDVIYFLKENDFKFFENRKGSHEAWINIKTQAVVDIQFHGRKAFRPKTLESMIRQSKIEKNLEKVDEKLTFCYSMCYSLRRRIFVMNEGKTKQLTVVGEYALVPTNKSVLKMAKRLRWTPERLIMRVEKALPAVMEQQVYLAVASDFGILPESMAKLLRLYLGHQNLRIDDLKPNRVGKNLRYSKFTSFSEYLRECLNLLKIVSKEYAAVSISIETAGWIVLNYGTDNPQMLIEMIDVNLEDMCEVLGISNELAYSLRMRTCIWLMVTKIIPENERNGCPNVLDVSDLLEMDSTRRHELRQLFQAEIPDYLAGNSYEVDQMLRKEGII